MYAKYQTDALILRSYPHGEADKFFSLYTKDFGLVRARASAVRGGSSRMRYGLQHFSRARLALIRGSRGWRVVGAVAESTFGQNMSAISAFARIARLVERVVTGEEKNDYLFAALKEGHAALAISSRESHATIELICVARALFSLGYLSNEALQTALFAHTAYGREELQEAEAMKKKLLSSVNSVLSETQL